MAGDPIISDRAKRSSVVVSNDQAASVLRNTYMLLALSLAVATGAAWWAMQMNIGFMSPLITLLVYFGLLMGTTALRNSAWGILMVFGLTGWLGFTTGPLINAFAHMPGGMHIVTLSLGGTTAIFFAMSAVALVTRKDFSFMGKFLMVGMIVAFLAGLGAMLFHVTALMLAVSAMFMFLSSMIILWETSRIVHGGETNYIMATVTLFVQLYNLFISLLNILSAANR